MEKKLRDVLLYLLPPEKRGEEDKVDVLVRELLGPEPRMRPGDLRNLERTLFNSYPISLVSVDVDSIKDYIFSTSKRRAIEGASKIIEEFMEYLRRDLERDLNSPFLLVYAGGGGAIFIVPSSVAGDFASRIEERFVEDSVSGSCTVSVFECYVYELIWGFDRPIVYPPDFRFRENREEPVKFGEIFKFISMEMEFKKASRYLPPLPAFSDGWEALCELCEVYPSVKREEIHGEEFYLCRSCLRKLEKGGKAETFENIAGDCGYLGALYMDGNRMGKKLSSLKSLKDYRNFSTSIASIIRDAFEFVVNDKTMGLEEGGKRYYIAPIMGGDDLFVIVSASKILDFALRFKKELLKRSEENELLKDITFSIGLLIIPSSYPLRNLLELVEQELSKAKEYAYEDEFKDDRFYISVRVETTSTPRKELVSSDSAENSIKMGIFPTTFGNFENLCDFLAKLRSIGFPRTQLYTMLSFWDGSLHPKVAELNMDYQLARLLEEYRDKLNRAEIEKWFMPVEKPVGKKKRCIPLYDLVSLWNFVPETWG